jgi:signal transduction histidine kinase/ActR/RegA family two-component response regulator
MRIRAYLLLMAIAILLPVIIFSTTALRMLQNAELATALQRLHESANGVSLLLDRELYSAESALRVLGASPSLAKGDLKEFYAQAKMADRGPNGWTVLADENSRQLINTLVPFDSKLPPPFEKKLAQQLIAANKTYVSRVRPGPVSQRLVTTLSIPVHTATGKIYILNSVFNTDHFKGLINSVRVPDGWLVVIIDRDGNFVARNLNADEKIGKSARRELVEAASQAATGQIRHHTLEGTEVYDAFTHSSLSGWTLAVAAPVDLIEGSARSAAMVATLGMLAAVLCAAGIALWFGNQHVNAIKRAAKAAADLGHGQPPEPVESSVIEVNALHAALYTAGIQLLQAQEYRKQSEAERQSLLLSEQSARQMAEKQNQAKDQFLAMLGHELRNPLAPISSAAQLLMLPGLDEKRVRYTSEIISRQVDHMNNLLQDLLDVSRVTRGLVKLNKEPVDVAAIVSAAVEQVRALAESKHQQLVLHDSSEPAWVNGDKTRLVQILINLLNNAAKYTQDGGMISLKIDVEMDWVVLSVSDNGSGITPDLLPHVFELFSQAERTLDRSQGGLGLGLALVKSLVELHGGKVTAYSEGAGKGSTFTVRLPQIAAPAQQLTDMHAAQRLHHSSRRSLRVMIVDDNADAAQSLANYLSEASTHTITVYYDGKNALGHVSHDLPDVFILDIGLPDMDGYALARRLRQMPQTADAVLIALTGYGQPQDMESAKAAGYNHHLSKPADPAVILNMLAEIAAAARY